MQRQRTARAQHAPGCERLQDEQLRKQHIGPEHTKIIQEKRS